MGRTVTIIIILAGILLFWLKWPEMNSVEGDLLKANIQHELRQDSITVAKLLPEVMKKENLEKLASSSFGIEIYKENILVWWNDVARLTPKIKDSRYLVFHTGVTDVVIRTELTHYKNVDILMAKNTGESLTHEHNLSFQGVNYVYQAAANWRAIAFQGILLAIWFILLYFLFYKAWQKKSDNRRFLYPVLYMFGSRILFSGGPVLSFFQDIFLCFPLGTSGLLFSPLTFSLDTALLWLVMYTIPTLKVFKELKVIPFLAAFLLGALFIYWNVIIREMVVSDRIFVDVSEILFFNASSIWVVVFLILHLIAGFSIISWFFSFANEKEPSTSNRYVYFLTGLLGTVPLFIWADIQVNPVLFGLFLVALVLIFDVYSELKEQKLTYMLWWMLLFSGYLAIGFFHYDQMKKQNQRDKFIEKNFYSAVSSDIANAKNVKQKLDTSSIFLKLGSLEFPAKWDKDEILELFSGLLNLEENQFDVELFDNNGFSLFSNHFGNYHQVKKRLGIGQTLEGNNLIFHPLHNAYYLQYEILPAQHPDGPWLFVLSLQKKISDARDDNNFSYALLKNGQVVEKKFKSNEIPSDRELLKIKSSGIHGNYIYNTRENNLGYSILVFEPKPGLLKPISIFSLLFTFMGLVFIILTWLNTKKSFLPVSMPLKLGIRSSLKTRIQLSIILLIIFSFIVVGAVTAFYFHNLIQANQSAKEREETQILANSVIQESRRMNGGKEILAYFYKNLLNLSYVHGKNLQLYDAQGKLLATSIADPMEYLLPYHDVNGFRQPGSERHTGQQEEHFDYIELWDNAGQKAGYLGIQHQYSDISSKSIVNFLGTILNVYIFLFLIGGVIAITIANSITKPIAILAEKLKEFKLGKSNDYLEWQSQDEIGSLITEYNNLNVALTRSAEMLAKTERDMAWREMAKQVAHEIKNPLTPMKLSIQYLEKTAKEDPERAKEMIPRVANTLIEQIDNLSQIAVEFSNFAAMPQATNEKVALNDLVVMIHDLFRKREDMDITMSMPIDDLVVFADKNHLVRILNNLVKNAIQAIPDDRRGKIDIALYKEQNHAIVRVTDNGAGIPESMKSKVFAPNFTTKSSGTGLGLAISANMIESFNGKIYFDSKVNEGTSFFIRIPLMKLDDYNSDTRVSLDDEGEL